MKRMESIIINPMVDMISYIIKKSFSNSTLDKNSIQDIKDEAKKQDISLQLAQQQAKVAQELAIALRIEAAKDVEIEEYYDNQIETGSGLNANREGVSIGIGGDSRRITKRIYKFKGYNGKNVEVYQKKLQEILLPLKKAESLKDIKKEK